MKPARVSFRLSIADREKLALIWPTRSFPDSSNPRLLKKFRSEQEYLEFVVRALNSAGSVQWSLFRYMLNPDFQEV